MRAYVGGAAAEGAAAMGAEAFATGDQVAFGAAPSLHTAAHEAAHVVQQRAGAHLKSGVGERGDAHERRADAVADAVVRGESGEPLLDQYAGPAGPPSVYMMRLMNLRPEDGVANGGTALEQIHAELFGGAKDAQAEARDFSSKKDEESQTKASSMAI